MAPEDSLVDTAPSLDYRWARDSWISENHPTVDISADRTTFMRSELNSAKKEEVRRLARYLDSYKSPKPRTILQSQMEKSVDKSMLVPQACSSPKSDSYALRNSQQTGRTTPALTHRSMSPTPTSQSTSWHKHSMRPSAGPKFETRLTSTSANDTFLSSTSPHVHRESLVKSPRVEQLSSTNFKPAEVYQVEDSHWKGPGRSQFIHHSEITPSPAKQKEEFYTAKQFVPTTDRTIEVDSLDIARPGLCDSPSVKHPISIVSLSRDTTRDLSLLNEQDHTQNGQYAQDRSPETSHISVEYATNMGTLGNLTRSASEHGSDLSKVDSQDISLQRAIATALQDRSTLDRTYKDNQFAELPLEEAIAARFRQSLMDKSHATNDQRESFVDKHERKGIVPAQIHVTRVGSEPSVAMAVDQFGTGNTTSAENEKDQTTLSNLNNSQMVEMLEALERVTEECCRRGHMIDELAENVASPAQRNNAVVEALETANKRSQELEVQLQQYREQVQQMAKDLQEVRSIAQSRPSTAIPTEPARLDANTSLRQPEVQFESQPLPSSLKTDLKPSPNTSTPAVVSPSNIEYEESFRDKVQRWEDNLEIVSNCGATMRQNDSISRAHEVLSRDLKFIPIAKPAADISQRTFTKHAANGHQLTEHLVTPRDAQIAELSHLSVGKKPSFATSAMGVEHSTAERQFQNDPKLVAALEAAEAEIKRLKTQLVADESKTPSKVNTGARPLTADMMPDAHDPYMCPEEKIFRRLQMARVEDLGSVELANLVKNILVQLDVPFDRLVETITALGAQAAGDAEVQDTMVHETIKLREFAEHVHATLYGGDHIEGVITSPTCLRNMAHRVDKMQRAIDRSRAR